MDHKITGLENFLPKILRNYVNIAKMDSDLPRGFVQPKPTEIPASKFGRRFSLRSKKEDEKCNPLTNRGLIDFPDLLLAENTPKTNENENLVVQNNVKEGVVTRYEYYGPPIDDPSILNLAPVDRQYRTAGSASTSGCCSCRGDENDQQNHERCDRKYAVLEQEISKLKSQIAQLSNTTTCPAPVQKPVAPPPPPPPPPPMDFLTAPKMSLKFSASSSSGDSSRTSSPRVKRRGSFGGSSGSPEEENFRKQLVNVLKDLENGRAHLKPVQKSPGGTPRKRALESRRKNAQSSSNTGRNCHDLLAEALKAKFANVHRRSSGGVGSAGNGAGAYFSDGENVNDSSWMDENTPTPKKSDRDRDFKANALLSADQISPTSGFNRSRIHTFS